MTDNKQHFGLQKIYIKDISFESPQPEKYFVQVNQPKINLDLNTESKQLDNNVHEVVLNITVSAVVETDDTESTLYLIELKQAGIFQLSGFSKEDLHRMVNCHCPNILFPYAREMISSLVERGGFPQLLLTPINFDALYEHHLQKLKQAEQAVVSNTKH